MKLLTVTVPCYNSQDYMRACVDSLLPGGDRVEIIIINDGSKDNTGAIADEYAAKYPDIVKVIHQENGGHGEGINQGLKHATGTYFKVVDSDDRLSGDFPRMLDALEQCEKDGGVQLFVTNYFYTHSDGVGDRSINYSNALPQGRIFGWADTKPFKMHQLLTIHSCTFRTETMRAAGLELPKHMFYEDNYMVYAPLREVDKLYYMNSDLYLYTIGREGQSVQEDVMKRRYKHQLRATELCFTAYRLDSVEQPMLRQYLQHELFMMLGISIMYARLNRSAEADADLEALWESFRAFDKPTADYFRHRSLLKFICVPGKCGAAFAIFMYRFANKVVRFN